MASQEIFKSIRNVLFQSLFCMVCQEEIIEPPHQAKTDSRDNQPEAYIWNCTQVIGSCTGSMWQATRWSCLSVKILECFTSCSYNLFDFVMAEVS